MQTIHKRIRKATSTPRGRIIALVILGLIVLAIVGGIVYWKIFRKQIIRGELENLVSNKSGGLYDMQYDSLFLDEAAGNLAIHGIRIDYDSLQYARLLKEDIPATLVRVSIPVLTVLGVQTPRALLSKEIVGKRLTISRPHIQIYYTNAGKDSAKYLPPREIYRQILGKLNMIRIDTLEIANAIIATHNLKSGKKIVELKNTSVTLMDVSLDENNTKAGGRILFSKNMIFNCELVSFPSEDRPYHYNIENISLNSLDSTGSVSKFRILPLMKEDAFVRSLPAQDDRFDFVISNIRIKKLDIPALIRENIFADSIVLGSATFKIYRDLALPRDKKNRVGRYPHQLLAKLPLSLRAKKLIITNGFLEYKERNHITRQSGRVQFYKINAVFDNVTNEPEAIEKNNVMTATMNTRFLDKTPLTVNWRFYLGNPRGRFDVKGNLGSIDAKEVNRLTEPMGPAKMEKGRIKSLGFDFKGDNYGTDGSVKMLYEDLKLSLLEKEKGKQELDKKNVASFVANIIVKNDNPTRKDPPRVIDTHFDRDTNRSIFHLVWKSIFKGIKETVGIKK